MNRGYYEQYRNLEINHWWFRGRERILRGLLEKQIVGDDPRILNVGAATGRTSEWLSSFGETVSVEYDPECAAMARQFTGLPIVVASAESLPFPTDSFDLVTAFDVIEHIDDHQKAVNELRRVCKPSGFVFVTVPAFPFLWGKHDEINHHFRRYRRGELRNLFSGCSILLNGYFNFWLFPPIAVARIASKGIRKLNPEVQKKNKSDFELVLPAVVNRILEAIFASERFLITRKMTFPIGVSELLVCKPNSGS